MQRHLSLCVVSVLLLVCGVTGQEVNSGQGASKNKKVLKNADVILMTQNHFDDATLIKMIEVSETDFDISSDALIDMSHQGVSSAVLRAMLESAQRKGHAAEEDSAARAGAGPGPVSASPSSSGRPSEASATTATRRNALQNSTPSLPAPSSAGANAFAGMQVRPGTMGVNPQQMAAMMSQLSMLGMGGMFPGMSLMNYSPEQMPHVFLMLGANKGKEEIVFSPAQIGQSKFKSGVSKGGMSLRSLATQGLSFAAMGAGPAGIMAMSAFSMASGFMPGMRPGAPSITYVWGLPGRKSAREIADPNPMFELAYGDIPGVDPDAYEPAVVKLFATKDNYRLVGATQTKMNSKNLMSGAGPESGKWISEERWPTRVDKEERGFYILHVNQPLEPGEYAVVLRPVKGYKANPSAFGGHAQVFYSVWDFNIPGTPIDDSGRKRKK